MDQPHPRGCSRDGFMRNFNPAQRTKDMKVEELHVVREHESACRKLKHRLDLGLKRDKVQTQDTFCMTEHTLAATCLWQLQMSQPGSPC